MASPLQKATEWVGDNWEYIAAGALVIGGIAVMATGVGGPLGAAMIGGALMSGGVSAGVQKATTGEVDWGKVAVDGMIGGLAGGAGAGAGALIGQSARVAAMNPFTRGVAINGTEAVVEGMASRGLTGENPFNPRGMAEDLIGTGKAKAPGGDLGSTAARFSGDSGGRGISIYRTAKRENAQDELDHGLNPANHEVDLLFGGEGHAYLGGESVARDWVGRGGYADYYTEFRMKPEFKSEFHDAYKADYDGNTTDPDRFEYQIPHSQIERFNELTESRHRIDP